MKVAQNDETNPNTQSVRPPRVPSIVNLQHFTSGSSVRKRETPGILSRMFPPFTGITPYCVRHTWHRYLFWHASLCICLHCIHCFFPLFTPVDYETDAAAGTPIDYGVDDPSFLPEQPGKQNPFDQQDITRCLLSYSCIRFATIVD